jgi:hypothetical protein
MLSTGEELWMAVAQYLSYPERPVKDETRSHSTVLINALLSMGNVTCSRGMLGLRLDKKPELVHSGGSLLSYLVFRLCLRVLWMDVMPRCQNCQMEYTPEERAPKRGDRHFFPECRDKVIPKKYALQDFRGARQKLRYN